MTRTPPPRRDEFPHFLSLSTRWMDNDAYGHVNNVAYYSFFDTAVNRYLIDQGFLDVQEGRVIGLVVETACSFFRPLSFPDDLDIGIRVDHLGTSSVRYSLGVFRRGDADAAAGGYFVHVYVDRTSRTPVSLPEPLRVALNSLTTRLEK
jgi:acyl-CoA thioester hydrolase